MYKRRLGDVIKETGTHMDRISPNFNNLTKKWAFNVISFTLIQSKNFNIKIVGGFLAYGITWCLGTHSLLQRRKVKLTSERSY